jgi:ferric-dicitrate binding protein FerR (iron transport regulator)
MSRLEELLARWEAGELSRTETAELKELLAAPQARADLVDEWLLTETIYDTLHTRPAKATSAELHRATARPSRAAGAPPPPPRSRPSRWLVWREVHISIGWVTAWGAAACLGLAGLWFYFQKAAVANLSEVRAEVVVRRDGRLMAAAAGKALYAGDVVMVPQAGAASVAWPGEPSVLTLSGGARLDLFNPLFGKRMALQSGAIEATVGHQSWLRPMSILTPEAEARVVGTKFSLTATGAVTRLEVLEGAVRFRKTRPTAVDRQDQVMVRAGHTSTAAAALPLDVGWMTGFLSSDIWAVPPGIPLSDALVSGAPLGPPAAATTVAAGSNCVERLRGYVLAPATGDYVFWVASHRGGAAVELWLSPDENPAHKRRIAYETPSAGISAPWTGASLQIDFRRSPTQQSDAQSLERGRRYYLEVWHAGIGLETLGIGWRPPGEPDTAPPQMVDLNVLCPFVGPVAEAARK